MTISPLSDVLAYANKLANSEDTSADPWALSMAAHLRTLHFAARTIRDTFKFDLARGYVTRDKQYVVEVLALAFGFADEPPPEPPKDREILVRDVDGCFRLVEWFDNGFTSPRWQDDEGRNVVFAEWWPLPPRRE